MTAEPEKSARLFGERLKALRKEMGHKQSAFARLIGISEDTLSLIERGRKLPPEMRLINGQEESQGFAWDNVAVRHCVPTVTNSRECVTGPIGGYPPDAVNIWPVLLDFSPPAVYNYDYAYDANRPNGNRRLRQPDRRNSPYCASKSPQQIYIHVQRMGRGITSAI